MRKPREFAKARRQCRPALVMLMVFAVCLPAIGSPVEGVDIIGVFGGFGGTFPGSYLNGGNLHTEDSSNSFHVWSSAVVFDPDAGTIAGEGSFTMVVDAVAGGGTVVQGSWKATKLRSYRIIGICRDNAVCLTGGPFGVDFPAGFQAGKMVATIELFDASGAKLGRARLTIWCSLPGIPFRVDKRDPMGRGIEQYRVQVISGAYKGLDFEVGRSGTVFWDMSIP